MIFSGIEGNRNEKSSTEQNKFPITGDSDILLLRQFHRQCHFKELITEKQFALYINVVQDQICVSLGDLLVFYRESAACFSYDCE